MILKNKGENMEKSNKRVKRPTDNKYKRGRGIHRGIIILVILLVVITSGYIIYNKYIKKEDKTQEVKEIKPFEITLKKGDIFDQQNERVLQIQKIPIEEPKEKKKE